MVRVCVIGWLCGVCLHVLHAACVACGLVCVNVYAVCLYVLCVCVCVCGVYVHVAYVVCAVSGTCLCDGVHDVYECVL